MLADLGFEAGGWRVEKHPRFLADITGDGKADIVGFGDAGVYVALANSDGVFQGPLRFVLPNFGYLLTVLAIARSDREIEDAGIWRSTDGGGTWSPVHSFPRPGGGPPAAGQLVWAPGTAHLVFAAGENSLGCQPGRRCDLADGHRPDRAAQPLCRPTMWRSLPRLPGHCVRRLSTRWPAT